LHWADADHARPFIACGVRVCELAQSITLGMKQLVGRIIEGSH